MGNSGDYLRRGKRLLDYEAVRNAFRGPLCRRRARHIDHRNLWVEFARSLGNLPTAWARPQLNVRNESPEWGLLRLSFFEVFERLRAIMGQ